MDRWELAALEERLDALEQRLDALGMGRNGRSARLSGLLGFPVDLDDGDEDAEP